MKSKKVTMLAAALVVAVVAAAGIGYATTAYTATTTNTNNTAQATYLIIEQTGGAASAAYDGDWLTKVYFDTVNSAANTNTYTLKKEYGMADGTISKTVEADKDMALISIPLALSVTKHNSNDASLAISITTENLTTSTAVDGLTYWIAVGKATTTNEGVISMTEATLVQGTVGASSTEWNGTVTATQALNETVTFDLLMFIKGTPTAPTSSASGASPGEYAGFSQYSTFVITVTAEE